MRLRKASSWFIGLVLAALATNAMFLAFISRSYDTVVFTQKHRQDAIGLAAELKQENEQLAHFVRSYASTGEARYLLYYYDVLAVREGQKPAPPGFRRGTYWDDVIAKRINHAIPAEGPKRSLSDTMTSLGFSTPELQAFRNVVQNASSASE